MRQYFDLTTWILLFAMAPFTILVLLSQNTIPGDLFYPVKRGMENVILVAASVNPGTKVAFRTDLTERRFTEAQKLLAIRADTTAFDDFVSEVSFTQGDIANFSNEEEQIESSEKLIAEINEYQNQLVQVQNQIQVAQESSFAFVPQNIAIQITPAPFETSQDQAAFVPTQTQAPITATSQPTQATPTATQPTLPSATPVQKIEQPTPTPLPSLTPAVVTEIANNPQKAEEKKQELTDAYKNLEKIEEQARKVKENAEFRENVRKAKELEEQRQKEESKKRGENGTNHR